MALVGAIILVFGLGAGILAAMLTHGAPTGGRPGGSPPPAASPKKPVPDVRGLTVSQAREVLTLAGLRLADVTPMAGTPGIVLRSLPQPGARVVPGRPIHVWVGMEPSPSRQQSPP